MLLRLLVQALSLWELGILLNVRGQVTNSFPKCATLCVTTAAQAVGCSLKDQGCLCKSDGFLAATQSCAFQACKGSDMATAAIAFARLCAAATVTLGPPKTSPPKTATPTTHPPASPPASHSPSATSRPPTSLHKPSTSTAHSSLPTTRIPRASASTSTSTIFISTGSRGPLPTANVNAATGMRCTTTIVGTLALAVGSILFV